MSFPGHAHVSEREVAHKWPSDPQVLDDAKWEDCTWCSAVMFIRATKKPDVPATHTEAELLRAASGEGPLGGSGTADIIRGVKTRYGITLAYKEALGILDVPIGSAVMTQGNMGAFPDGHRLRRWDPSFEGNHEVFVARLEQGWWWDDPLAPAGTYKGEWIAPSDLLAFVKKLPGADMFVLPILALGEPMTTITILPFGGKLTVPAGAAVTVFKLDGPNGTVGTRKPVATSTSARTWNYDATMTTSATRGNPFLRISSGTYAGYFVGAAAVNEVANVDPTTVTAKQLADAKNAAYADGKTAGMAEGRAAGYAQGVNAVLTVVSSVPKTL